MKKLFVVFILLLIPTISLAQITTDNNGLEFSIPDGGTFDFMIPTGENKVLVILALAALDRNLDINANNGNGVNVTTALPVSCFKSFQIWHIIFGDVITTDTVTISHNLNQSVSFWGITLNNVNQTSPLVSRNSSLGLESRSIIQNGSFEKKNGDLNLNYLAFQNDGDLIGSVCPQQNRSIGILNSNGNTLNLEYELDINNQNAPVRKLYTSTITSNDEYTAWFLQGCSPVQSSIFSISASKLSATFNYQEPEGPVLNNPVVNFSTKQLNVFPVPSSNNLNLGRAFKGNYSIFNLGGQIVLSNSKISTFESIDISGLASGSYILNIKTEDNRIYNKTFVVE